jgi:hypothetical protein
MANGTLRSTRIHVGLFITLAARVRVQNARGATLTA